MFWGEKLFERPKGHNDVGINYVNMRTLIDRARCHVL